MQKLQLVCIRYTFCTRLFEKDISSDKFGELYEVDFIFCKQTNDSTYSTLSYKGNKEIEEIPEEIRAKISESIK